MTVYKPRSIPWVSDGELTDAAERYAEVEKAYLASPADDSSKAALDEAHAELVAVLSLARTSRTMVDLAKVTGIDKDLIREWTRPRITGEVAEELQRRWDVTDREERKQLLGEYISWLRAAGWSVRDIASVLGCTRQNVHYLNKDGEAESFPPEIPVRPKFADPLRLPRYALDTDDRRSLHTVIPVPEREELGAQLEETLELRRQARSRQLPFEKRPELIISERKTVRMAEKLHTKYGVGYLGLSVAAGKVPYTLARIMAAHGKTELPESVSPAVPASKLPIPDTGDEGDVTESESTAEDTVSA